MYILACAEFVIDLASSELFGRVGNDLSHFVSESQCSSSSTFSVMATGRESPKRDKPCQYPRDEVRECCYDDDVVDWCWAQ